MLDSQPFDVVATLAPVRRRLTLERVGRWGLAGVGAGAGIGALLLLLTRVWSLPLAPTLSMVAVLVGGLAGVAVGAYRRPTLHEAARMADRYFGLHDRLTTALDYRSSEDSFPLLQRADVARRLRGVMLVESGRGEMTWRRSAFPGIAILALIALLLLGMPPNSPVVVRATSGGEGQRIHSVAATQMPAVLQNLERGLTPQERKGVAVRKLEHTLTRLQHQLQRTSSRPAALRAISVTQQQLRQLAASLHPINSQAVAQLNHSLGQYMPRQQRSGSSTSGQSRASAGAQALGSLNQALSHLSAGQRAQLARALAQAAKQSPDSGLRSALAKAASALAKGNTAAARKALNQAAAALGQSARTSATQSQLNSADSQLDSLKNSVSGFGEDNPSSEAGAQQGGTSEQSQLSQEIARQRLQYEHGGPQPNGQGSRSAGGSGTRNGSSGNGRGNGQTQGSGSGRGAGQGQGRGSGQFGSNSPSNAYSEGHGQGAGASGGGSGTHGMGGGRGNAGKSGQAGYVTVYIPGVHGKGPQTTQTGPSGTPGRKSLVPYRLVIAQYSQSAHTALDRSDLPPSLQSYIRDYFASVSQ